MYMYMHVGVFTFHKRCRASRYVTLPHFDQLLRNDSPPCKHLPHKTLGGVHYTVTEIVYMRGWEYLRYSKNVVWKCPFYSRYSRVARTLSCAHSEVLQ